MGSKQVVHWTSETWWEWSEIAGSSQGSLQQLTPWLWSWKEDLQRAWNWDRRAVWDQVGLSHCRDEGLVMVRDKDRLRRGYRIDQSCRGHQCSETTLTGKSRFHISTSQGIWTWVPYDGKQTGSPLDQWDMVRMEWDYRLSTNFVFDYKTVEKVAKKISLRQVLRHKITIKVGKLHMSRTSL